MQMTSTPPCPFCAANIVAGMSRDFAGKIFCDNCGASAPKEIWGTRGLAQTVPDLAAGMKKAMEIVGEMRMSEAGIFDEKHSGQRGEDRSSALYDAYVEIRSAIPPATLPEAGIIDWKMEAERANRLLADAQKIIAEYQASTIAGATADVAAHGMPGVRGQGSREPRAWAVLHKSGGAIWKLLEDKLSADYWRTQGFPVEVLYAASPLLEQLHAVLANRTDPDWKVLTAARDALAVTSTDREGTTVYLREVDAGTDSACWVVCNRVDAGAVAFVGAA